MEGKGYQMPLYYLIIRFNSYSEHLGEINTAEGGFEQ